MLKKLQAKFIAVSMLSLFVVLFVIVGGVNIWNYHKLIKDADMTLRILSENHGRFPNHMDEFMNPAHPDKPPMSPELPYESRYFSVLISGAGNVISADTGRIAAIDTETAMRYALMVNDSAKTSGFVSNYRFLKFEEHQETLIVFLDCGRSLDTFRTYLLVSCLLSLCGLLSVLILLCFLSGKIMKPIAESYDKQRRFISDAGHEIKTPLSIIAADAEVLETEIGENEWLTDIQTQTSRLAELTKDLIYLSRMEEQIGLQDYPVFPLSETIEETVHSFQSVAITNNHELVVSVQPMLSFKGDESALRKVTGILLDNALKYAKQNSAIQITLKSSGKSMLFQVDNYVENLNKEILPYMFDRFYREDKSRNSTVAGYGIGLSIAKAIVDAHHGTIRAQALSDELLRVEIVFPQKKDG